MPIETRSGRIGGESAGQEEEDSPMILPIGETEIIEQRYARLSLAIQRRQQMEEIEKIKLVLSGRGTPASRRSEVSYKRPASTELSGRSKRVMPPPIYKGANLLELRDFLLGCDVFFDAIKE